MAPHFPTHKLIEKVSTCISLLHFLFVSSLLPARHGPLCLTITLKLLMLRAAFLLLFTKPSGLNLDPSFLSSVYLSLLATFSLKCISFGFFDTVFSLFSFYFVLPFLDAFVSSFYSPNIGIFQNSFS